MAARFEALNRLWESIRESNHDFRASTDIFPILDVEKISRSLELHERGTENGAANRPVKSARALDDVEQRIVAKVEEEKKTSYQLLEDQFHTFSDRLRNLDFEGQFGLIRQANASSLSDFKAEVASGVDELHGLRRDLKIAEDELSSFKQKHSLDRAAKVTSSAAWGFKVSLLVLLLFLETALNGNFLARGSEQGLVGGITEAFTFAFLNIGSAVLLAFFCVRYLVHRGFFPKFLGLLGLVAYCAIAIGINLALAHYREASATTLSLAGTEVMRRLSESPLTLSELNSWMLFGVGLMFSAIAFVDGCLLTDPYPGFAGVQKRLHIARQRYIDRKQDLIDDLRDIRDDHNEKVEQIIRDLSMRRQEALAIISHRSRGAELFIQHQNQLERAANSLLTIYREANRQARTEPEPKYFSAPYEMDRLNPSQHVFEEWNDRELAQRIQTAQAELSVQVKRIGAEFETAIDRYHQLDNLFPEGINGQAQAA
ncbi:hypothetical protein PYH37_001530 [Sinorhizobium numidicum]|uniref:Transmembrane protein n=1 Tax=Sinorhizobium numidicum TaxID=680248 RepID=A0ABY8CNA5_9HYPH|nr:hypothetical protein [Sinorhizobium numidicum]WEX74145.1 hypothetical protein PYH37_001530 [Sinorhizobium numidicum]WEX80130.1 hypothetical protein PYH38_001531 [Sinorhizobium numidicum]